MNIFFRIDIIKVYYRTNTYIQHRYIHTYIVCISMTEWNGNVRRGKTKRQNLKGLHPFLFLCLNEEPLVFSDLQVSDTIHSSFSSSCGGYWSLVSHCMFYCLFLNGVAGGA